MNLPFRASSVITPDIGAASLTSVTVAFVVKSKFPLPSAPGSPEWSFRITRLVSRAMFRHSCSLPKAL